MKKRIILTLFVGFLTLLINTSNVKADNFVECIYEYEHVATKTIIRVNTTKSSIISVTAGINSQAVEKLDIKYSDIIANNSCTKKNLYYAAGSNKIATSNITGDRTSQKIVFKEQKTDASSTNLRTCSYQSKDCFSNTVIIVGDLDPEKRNIVSVNVNNNGVDNNNVNYSSLQFYDIFNVDGTCKDGSNADFVLYYGIGPIGGKVSAKKDEITSSNGYTNICNYSAKTDVIVNDEPIKKPDDGDDIGSVVDHSNDVACGDVYNMPKIIPQITSLFFNFVKILTPIILIIKGLIDIFKAVTSAKEDEISKAKGKFFKRLVPAVIVFLVVLLAQVVFGIVGTSKESANISQCLNCFLNGPSNCQLNSTVAPENIPTSDGTINWTKYVNKINNSRTDSSNCGNKCRENSVNGIVKVINGVFYYIGGSTYNGTSSSKGTGQKNLNVTFSNRLNQFFTAADQEGYTIWIKYEGWRSLNQQKYYYCCYTGQYLNSKSDSGNICSGAKKCNNGNKAATPGTSNHGYGLAADLGFCYGRNNKSCENDNPTAIAWAKNNASKYGLKFNVPEEDWHIVPYDMVDVTK